MVTYDLRGPSREVASNVQAFRRAMVALAVAFGALAVWVVGLALSPDGLHDSTQKAAFVVLESGLSAMVGLFVFGIWKLGTGATAISIDYAGIRFEWGAGRVESLAWGHLERGLVLLDFSGNPLLSTVTKYLWEVRRWNRPSTRLTREAFDALFEGAAQHGVTWGRRNHPNSFLGYGQCLVFRPRGPKTGSAS
jgi:hypothetical protein